MSARTSVRLLLSTVAIRPSSPTDGAWSHSGSERSKFFRTIISMTISYISAAGYRLLAGLPCASSFFSSMANALVYTS
jgi:hypothetical protein